MNTVAELEQAIEKLPEKEFQMLAAWIAERSRARSPNIASAPAPSPAGLSLRDHTAFLNSYTADDEGLYDDAATR